MDGWNDLRLFFLGLNNPTRAPHGVRRKKTLMSAKIPKELQQAATILKARSMLAMSMGNNFDWFDSTHPAFSRILPL